MVEIEGGNERLESNSHCYCGVGVHNQDLKRHGGGLGEVSNQSTGRRCLSVREWAISSLLRSLGLRVCETELKLGAVCVTPRGSSGMLISRSQLFVILAGSQG